MLAAYTCAARTRKAHVQAHIDIHTQTCAHAQMLALTHTHAGAKQPAFPRRGGLAGLLGARKNVKPVACQKPLSVAASEVFDEPF
jgi:hypothetical protein